MSKSIENTVASLFTTFAYGAVVKAMHECDTAKDFNSIISSFALDFAKKAGMSVNVDNFCNIEIVKIDGKQFCVKKLKAILIK